MPKTKAAPRRTRRMGNPFDASVEVRLYSTEKAKLFAEAKERGLSASDLIRQQLGDLIAAAPPVATEEPETVPLTDLIAERTGCSIGHALLTIRLGKVTVNGEPWHRPTIPASLVGKVSVAGLALPE